MSAIMLTCIIMRQSQTISDVIFYRNLSSKISRKILFRDFVRKREKDSSVRDDTQRKRFKNTIIWLSFIYEQPWK